MRAYEDKFYTDKKERVIYILVDKPTSQLYISQCLKRDIKDIYSRHSRGMFIDTKHLFEAPEKPLENNPKKPPIFVCFFAVENFNDTKEIGFKKIVAWTRYFREHGYEIMNKGELISYSKNLYSDTQKHYDNIKDTDIENLLKCINCIVKSYKFSNCPMFN